MGAAVEISYYLLDHQPLLDHQLLLAAMRQFSMLNEANIPTWYSTLLLASCALALAVIGFSQSRETGGYRRHWLILSLIFLYISMDEASVIHEMSIRPIREAFNLRGALYYAWTLPAGLLGTIFLLGYLGFLRNLPASSRNRIISAGLIYVGGAFGTEFIASYMWETQGDTFAYAMVCVLQESMEIAGASLFLSALLRHLASEDSPLRIRLPI